MSTLFDTYLAQIQADLKGGKATEHTYRSALESLLEVLTQGVKASNEAKHIRCGAPDFVVALKETIRLMEEIDKTIPAWPIEWLPRF